MRHGLRHSDMRRTQTRQRQAAAAAALTLLLLAGCSGQGSADSTDAGSQAAETPVAPSEGNGRDADSVKSADGGGSARTSVPTLESPDVIKTGKVSIVAKDLARVREDIDRLLAQYGGGVAEESTRNDDDGRPIGSRLVLRVPSRWFSDVMDAFGDKPSVKSTDIDTEDVHAQVIDVRSRVATLRSSLVTLRGFLRRSTDVDTMLRNEERITQVESELASLTAQRNYLADQTLMSTVNVDMRTPKAPPAEHEADPLAHAGFLSGLANGWSALEDVLVVVATVLGAALPFAVLGVLVGLPAWLVLRRRRPLVEDGH